MVPHFIRQRRRSVELLNGVEFAARESNRRLDAVVALRTGRLHATTALRAMRTHVLDVDRSRDHLHICEGELRALSDNASVERYHRAAIVIQPIPIASLLIRVEVHAAELHRKKTGCLSETKEGINQAKRYLERSLFNELDASVELPEFVVTPTRICEDLNTVETHQDMRATKNEKQERRDHPLAPPKDSASN